LREEAEEDADQEALQRVARVAAGRQRVVKLAHDLGGLDVDRVLPGEGADLVAGDESEELDVAVEVLDEDLDALDMLTAEERQVAHVLGFQVEQCETVEIGDDDVARDLLVAPLVGEGLQVVEGLGFGLVEAPAPRLVLDQQAALPE